MMLVPINESVEEVPRSCGLSTTSLRIFNMVIVLVTGGFYGYLSYKQLFDYHQEWERFNLYPWIMIAIFIYNVCNLIFLLTPLTWRM